MSNFLEDYNQNPSLTLLDSQWQEASKNNLHHSVMLYASMALQKRKQQNLIKFPEDTDLFTALSISGYYTKDINDRNTAKAAVNTLCIEKNISTVYRDLARKNQLFYTQQLDELTGPFDIKKFDFDFDYHATNPSILNWKNKLWMIQRTVNYTIDENERYNTGLNDPIKTKNYLVELNDDLSIAQYQLIREPDYTPLYNLVLGFEDCRLFSVQDELYCIATNRDHNKDGQCQIALAKIIPSTAEMVDVRILSSPDPSEHQKNWMPFSSNDSFRFLYLCDPTTVIDHTGKILNQFISPVAAENFRGGGQLIDFENGFLAIVHESVILDNSLRNYVHRFVRFDRKCQITGISPRFKFSDNRIEFAAGLAWHPNHQELLISFGINDQESCLAIVDYKKISKIIEPYSVLQSINQPVGPTLINKF